MLYLFDDFVLDTDRRELHRGSKRVSLAPQVFDLLEFLIYNRERVVTKDNLWASIWDGRVVSDSALNTRINAARRAIDDSGEEQRLIRTLPRKGLRFIGEVREEQKPPRLRGPEGAMAAERQGPALIHPDWPSIAVLPFVNMSGDPKQNSFADGIAEEIITALSHCSRMFVVARNSSFAYKGRSVDVRQVGRELGVRYVLEGSIRRGATVFALRDSLLMRHREDTSGPIGSKAKWVMRLIFKIALPKVLSPQSSRNCNKPRLSD